jgi:hydrogenase expression/formation protein HypC
MCLAVPGRIESTEGESPELRQGTVDFSGLRRKVSLAFTPEAREGDYVLVHAGFALSVVDEEEAGKIFEELRRLGEAESGAGA